MTKKSETKVSKDGAVELTEDALDNVQGASGDFHIKFDASSAQNKFSPVENKFSPGDGLQQKVNVGGLKAGG